MADTIQLSDTAGNLVDVPSEDATTMQATGLYQPVSAQQQQAQEQEAAATTPRQQALSFAEGAAKQTTFGLSTLAETKLLGQDPADIAAREQYNPGWSGLGQVVGAVANPLIPAAAKALVPEIVGAGYALRVGSAAARSAIETSIMQGTDEVSKMALSDPDQTAQTALLHLRNAALIGGGIGIVGSGVISPLWKAVQGSGLAKTLKAVADRAGGASVPAEPVNEALEMAGIDADPALKAGLSQDPSLKQMFGVLHESASSSGDAARAALKDFRGQVADKALGTLGVDPDAVENIVGGSANEAGESIKAKLGAAIKARFAPSVQQFEDIADKFGATELLPEETQDLTDRLANIASDYENSPSSPQMKELNRVIGEMPLQTTLEKLRTYQSVLADNWSPELSRVNLQMRAALREAEGDILDNNVVKYAPDLKDTLSQARQSYGESKALLDSLNDRLHVGPYRGMGSFLSNLQDMTGETVLNRLTPTKDASLLQILQSQFPEIADDIRQGYLTKILPVPAKQAIEGQSVSAKALFTRVDALSPELKQFLIRDPKTYDILNKLTESIPEKIGQSGTPRGLDALWKGVPGTVLGMAVGLLNHAPFVGVLTKLAADFLSKDMPDAIKMSYLRYLGSSAPLDAGGFKAMTEYFHSAIEGLKMTQRGAQAALGTGGGNILNTLPVSQSDRDKLESYLDRVRQQPQIMLNTAGKLGHYLPEHASAVAQLATRTVQYLESVRPHSDPAALLDSKPPINQTAQAQWNRTLDLAQQPLLAYKHIADGTLTQQDVNTIQAIAPASYASMNRHLMQEVINRKQDPLPYQTRMTLSTFLGQPVDSNLVGHSILAAQPLPQVTPQVPAGGKAARKTSALGKNSSMYSTPEQTREQRLSKP